MTDLVITYGQVAVDSSPEITRLPSRRKGSDDPLLGPEPLHGPDGWAQVAVSRDEERGVITVQRLIGAQEALGKGLKQS
jgi:hypothetical protein